jgi:hypothetical protein
MPREFEMLFKQRITLSTIAYMVSRCVHVDIVVATLPVDKEHV